MHKFRNCSCLRRQLPLFSCFHHLLPPISRFPNFLPLFAAAVYLPPVAAADRIMNISSSSTSLIQFVQMHLAASNPFENVEGITKSFDNPLEGVERVGWFLASSYASQRNYRSLKRLSVRFPRPMVKMKSMKYVGKARPKSWRWVNSALRLTYKCLLIIAFDIVVRVLRWIQERSVAHSLEARVLSFLEDKEALGGVIVA